MDTTGDVVERIRAFLAGRTDRLTADTSVPGISATVAETIAARVDATDWFLVFHKDRPRPAGGPPPARVGREAGETVLDAGPGDPRIVRHDALARDVREAVVRVTDELVNGADGEALLRGVDDRENTARRRLARAVARRMWCTDELPVELERVYWPAVAEAIRLFLLRHAECPTGEGGEPADAGGTGKPNGHSVLFELKRPGDWIAADALCRTTRAENPTAADVFELHLYAGVTFGKIAEMKNLTKEAVSDECHLLEAEWYAESR